MKPLSFFLFILFQINLYADAYSFFWENDVVSKNDRHYTNGISLLYLSNKDTNNSKKYDNSFYRFLNKVPTFNNNTKYQSYAFNYSHLAFTPEDIKTKEKIKDDLPYAGVITLDFILFKWEENFFHEYMLTLGAVGPMTNTDNFQSGFHQIISAPKPQGWNNQLENDFLYNFAYAYGTRAYAKSLKSFDFDITNSLRVDFGKLTRDIQFGTNFRIGQYYPKTLNSVGRFLGSNENKLLNLSPRSSNKKLKWSLSYGMLYNYNDYFYVSDHDKSYEHRKINNIFSEIISLDTYYKNFVFSLNLKSSVFVFNRNEHISESWGGFNIVYLF